VKLDGEKVIVAVYCALHYNAKRGIAIARFRSAIPGVRHSCGPPQH